MGAKLPEKAFERVLQLVSEGLSVAEACRQDDTPCQKSFYEWLKVEGKSEDRLQRYAHARDSRADVIFEEMIEIADDASNDWMERQNRDGSTTEVLDTEHVQRSRLRIETRKWMLGKMSPAKYGDKLDVQHGGNVIVEIKK